MLVKEIKGDLTTWRDILCSWNGKLNIKRKTKKFNSALNWSVDIQKYYENLSMVFVDTDKLILKFIWKEKKLRIAKYFQKKKKKVGEIILLNIKAYSRAITVWYWTEG